MKPAPFNYHAPTSVDEALALMSSLENAKVLAGGQSLVPMMNFRFVMPDHLVDLRHIDELSGISDSEGRIRIGAMTRQRDIEFNELIGKRAALFHSALEHVGHRQTRNRGTLGGSLAHADPAAELPAVLSVLDADITIASASGRRVVSTHEFAKGFMATDVGEDELLVDVSFLPWAGGHGYSFQEFARRHGDFAVVGVGAALELSDTGAIARTAISVCGAGTNPQRLSQAEELLAGQKPCDDLFDEAAGHSDNLDVIEDVHASSNYRRHLARVLTARALKEAWARANGRHAA